MKKVTIMALHLGYGGVEKAIADLSNSLCKYYEVEIISTYKLYDKPINGLDSSIKVKYLMTDRKPNRTEFINALKKFKLITVFKEFIKALVTLYNRKKLMIKYIKDCKSDIIISTRIFHNNILTKYGSEKSLRVAWEHNYHNDNKKYIKKLIKSVRKLDNLVVVSSTLYNDYKKLLSESKCKCVFIPNMISIDVDKLSDVNNNNLITVSRLSEEKGIFDLIDVVDIVRKKRPDVLLNLIGDGPLFDKVLAYIKNKNIADNVHLLGYRKSKDVYKYLKESSLYVMTSYTESFGIALLEAFSFGVPAIAFDSANGACEIINSSNGFLISNRNKNLMAQTIIDYLDNKDLRKKLSIGTQKDLPKYSSECIIVSWRKIFK